MPKGEGAGRIVNVGSVASQRSFIAGLTYSGSKAALDQITRCMAVELGSKYKVLPFPSIRLASQGKK